MKTETKLALIGTSISLFMMNLDTSIVSVGMPTMIKEFHTTFASGQWFVLIYLLVLTALITAAGRLGDLAGRKTLFLAGIGIFTVASLLCGLSPNAPLFILFRGIQGLGAAFILSLSMAIATELAPPNQLGKIMGILSTVTALGIASGPTVGGLLLSTIGWQSMFLVNVPFGIIAYGLTYKGVPSTGTKKIVNIDWVGIVLLAITLSAYCVGMTLIEKRALGDAVVPLAATIAGMIAFVWFEKKKRFPLLNLSIFRNKQISRNLLATILVYTVIITTVVFPPFYLSKTGGYSPIQVGLIMSFGPLLTVALSVYAGKTADKYGAKKVMFYAVGAIALGCFCMSTITQASPLTGYLWRIGIIALGLNFFKTPNNTVVMEAAQSDQRGVLSSFLSLSRILGQITGTAVMGVVFAFYGFTAVFLVNAFIAVFAAALILPLKRRKLVAYEGVAG